MSTEESRPAPGDERETAEEERTADSTGPQPGKLVMFLGHGAESWFERGGDIIEIEQGDTWRVYTGNGVLEVENGDAYCAAVVAGCRAERRRPEIEIGGWLYEEGWPGDVEITYRPPLFSATADAEEVSALEADIVDCEALSALQPPPPLVADVLYRETYAIVSGRDRSLKSFLALDWALCLATGTRWHGHDVERVPVLFVAGEGLLGIHGRVAAWQAHHGKTVEPGMFRVLKRPTNLHTGHEMAALVDHVRRNKYGLVVLDTLRKMSGAASENDASDMAVIISNILELKRATESGSILVVAHTAKSDLDTRGSSSIEDDSDTVWHLKWERGEKSVIARNTKQKDTEDGAAYRLTPQRVAESIVLDVEPVGGESVDPWSLVPNGKVREWIMRLDALSVPRDASVKTCREAISAAHMKISGDLLTEVVRVRKGLPK